MQLIKEFFNKNEFWKNVSTLTVGSFLSQLIPFLLAPILAEIYNPEDFGLFSFYFSCTMLLTVFTCGKYDLSILLPKNDEEQINLLVLCILISSLFLVFNLGFGFVFKKWILELLNVKFLDNYLFLIPISAFLIGFNQALISWANAKKQYIYISTSAILKSFTSSISGLLSGLLGFVRGGLIFSDILSQVITIFFLFKVFNKKLFELSGLISFSTLKRVAIRYKKFPQFYILSGLFEKIAGNAPILFLTIFFNPIEAGFFALAIKIISLPVSLISNSIGYVFREEASLEYKLNGNSIVVFKKTFNKLLLLGIPLLILMCCFVFFLFQFLFENKWDDSLTYCKIIIVMCFLQFIVSPLSYMFIIAEKQNVDMIKSIIVFLICIFAFWIAKEKFNNPVIAIKLYAIIYSIKYVIEFYFSRRFSQGLN